MEHLGAIHAFISMDSPQYAKRVVDRLTRRSEQIGLFPLSGRTVPEAGYPQIREVIEGPYRIVYHIKADQIDVIALQSTARNARLGARATANKPFAKIQEPHRRGAALFLLCVRVQLRQPKSCMILSVSR